MTITLHIAFLIFLSFVIWFIHNNSIFIFEKKTDVQKKDTNRKLLSKMFKETGNVKTIQEDEENLNYENELAEWFKTKSDNIYNNVQDENTSKISDLPKID